MDRLYFRMNRWKSTSLKWGQSQSPPKPAQRFTICSVCVEDGTRVRSQIAHNLQLCGRENRGKPSADFPSDCTCACVRALLETLILAWIWISVLTTNTWRVLPSGLKLLVDVLATSTWSLTSFLFAFSITNPQFVWKFEFGVCLLFIALTDLLWCCFLTRTTQVWPH